MMSHLISRYIWLSQKLERNGINQSECEGKIENPALPEPKSKLAYCPPSLALYYS